MKVQSTGLGKSVMIAHIGGISITDFDGEKTMKMTMESTEPLHWYIQVYMEPKDVRQAVFKGLRPSIIWKSLIALLFGRFSLFTKAGGEEQLEEQAPTKAEKSKSPPQPRPPMPPSENDKAVSPLAKLKG